MRRVCGVILGLILVFMSVSARAAGPVVDSSNMHLLETTPVNGIPDVTDTTYWVQEMAFEGDLMVAGVTQHSGPRDDGSTYTGGPGTGVAIFRLFDRPPYLEQISFFECNGAGEVTLYRNLLMVSANQDDLSPKTRCNRDGLRLVDISKPRHPRQVGFIENSCGLFTHTLAPSRKHLYAYASSCSEGWDIPTWKTGPASEVAVLKINIDNPARSRLASYIDIRPMGGCQDIVFHPGRELAACIGDSRFGLMDTNDRGNPEFISQSMTVMDRVFAGGGNFAWDGSHLIVGASSLECNGTDGAAPIMVFDIEDPAAPLEVGRWTPEQDTAATEDCSPKQMAPLPMRTGRPPLISMGYGTRGVRILDLSDPASPKPWAHYVVPAVDPADDDLHTGRRRSVVTAYWYNGKLYSADAQGERVPHVAVYSVRGTTARDVMFFTQRLNPQTITGPVR